MNVIAAIKNALSESLPGEMAQNKMAPDNRYPYGDQWPDPATSRNSSVMLMLYFKNDEWYIPLIQRPSYNGAHSGQVSFPGGKWEAMDTCAWDAALRETAEEIGVIEGIERLGNLTPLYIPHSNFMVYPQVGWYNGLPSFLPDAFEVESIIEAPLKEFINPVNCQMFTYQVGHLIINAPFFNISGHRVWGATAMIISEFLDVLIGNNLWLNLSDSCNAHNVQAPL